MDETIGPDANLHSVLRNMDHLPDRMINIVIDEYHPVRQRRLMRWPVAFARQVREELVRMTLEGKL